MNCKNCGMPLVEGQVICSNCNMENFVNTSVNQFNMTNNNFNYNSQSNETYNAYESDFNETKPKKEKNTILIVVIVLAVVILAPFILLGLLALVMVVSTNKINSTIKNSRADAFVSEYKIISKEVQQLSMLGENVVCDENCNQIYNFNNEIYELDVEDVGSYYKIEFELDDDYNANLSSSDCETLRNTMCNGNEIIGRIYKQ